MKKFPFSFFIILANSTSIEADIHVHQFKHTITFYRSFDTSSTINIFPTSSTNEMQRAAY